MNKTSPLLLDKVKGRLKTDFIGREIYHFVEVASTNDVAKELAIKGARDGTTIIAEAQSCGRGRLGRWWISPRGGIWFSIILRPRVSAEDALKLTLATAVAVAKTIRKALGLDAEIKWPNDVLINGRKVCGVLTEMGTRGDAVDFVVVGVGINANIDMEALPKNLRGLATSLKEEIKKGIDREEFLSALLKELEDYYNTFVQGKFALILEEWKGLTSMLGAQVEVVSANELIKGQAINVDHNGALIVKLEDGSIKRVLSGSIQKVYSGVSASHCKY